MRLKSCVPKSTTTVFFLTLSGKLTITQGLSLERAAVPPVPDVKVDLAVDVSAGVTVDVAFGVDAAGEVTVGLGAVIAETRGHCFRRHC